MSIHQSIGFMSEADARAADMLSPDRATVRAIAKEVAEYTGHSVTAIMGNSRLAQHCRVRELVCYIAYRHGLSYPRIGRALHRDHTTIINAVDNERRRRGEIEG